MAVIVSKQIKVPSVGKKASDYAVGDSVFLPVNGTNTEFLVVHQGNPDSSIYSTTFNDGTILLMKEIYAEIKWNDSSKNDYENSTIHTNLETTFFSLLGTSAQNAIMQVKIPYRAGSGTSKTVTSGENGLSAKIFLLSGAEVGLTDTSLPTSEGAKLDYFESGTGTSAKDKRIAKLSGTASKWWLRSPYCNFYKYYVYGVSSDGVSSSSSCTGVAGMRPALVIDNTTLFDPNTNIIKG